MEYGTLLFNATAFGTGRITQARYQMMALDAAAKYKGYALEFEYYSRWLDDFEVVGVVPYDDFYDQGFTLQLIGRRHVQALTGAQALGRQADVAAAGERRRDRRLVRRLVLAEAHVAVGTEDPAFAVVGGELGEQLRSGVERYAVPNGSEVFVADGQEVTPGQMLVKSPSSERPPPNSPFSSCRWSMYQFTNFFRFFSCSTWRKAQSGTDTVRGARPRAANTRSTISR